jgi:hypothetical protein
MRPFADASQNWQRKCFPENGPGKSLLSPNLILPEKLLPSIIINTI